MALALGRRLTPELPPRLESDRVLSTLGLGAIATNVAVAARDKNARGGQHNAEQGNQRDAGSAGGNGNDGGKHHDGSNRNDTTQSSNHADKGNNNQDNGKQN